MGSEDESLAIDGRPIFALVEAALSHAPVGVGVLDSDLRYRVVNAALAEANGVSVADHIGRRGPDVVPGIDPRAFDVMRQVFQTGQPVLDQEVSGETAAQPGVRHWLVSHQPLFGPDGKVEFVVATVVDVTVQRQMREALDEAAAERTRLLAAERKARRSLETVLAAMPVGVVVADEDGALIINNAQLEAIWHGVKWSRSVQEYAEWDGYHPDGLRYEATEWPMARSLQDGEVVTDEQISIRRLDGSPGVISLSSAPIRNEEGEIAGAVGVVTDITERAEASARRDAFVGVLSHELRTPVTVILGAARLLASERVTPDEAIRRELVGDIVAEGERLDRRIADLVILSRLERNIEIDAPSEPVILQRMLPDLVRAKLLQAADIRLVFEPDLPVVRANAGFLEQVLVNLLSNAIKYGEGQIEVRVAEVAGEVRVVVSDRGPGVDLDEVERVFELFFRSEKTARRATGAGIGLFISRALVEAMHGRLWVEENPGGGAALTVALPLWLETSDGA